MNKEITSKEIELIKEFISYLAPIVNKWDSGLCPSAWDMEEAMRDVLDSFIKGVSSNYE